MQPKHPKKPIALGISFVLGLFLILVALPTPELMANVNGDNIFFASTNGHEVVEVDMDGPTLTPTATQLPNCPILTPTPTVTLPVVQREGPTPTPDCVTVTPTPTPSGANVTVSSNVFTPDSVTINVGESVTWENIGGFHDVVADDGSFTSGSPAGPPWTYSHTFDTAGSYQYYCSVHGGQGGLGMSGIVIVQEGPTATPITNTPTVTGTPPTSTPTPFVTPTATVTGTPPTSTPTPFVTPSATVTGTPPTSTPTPFVTPTASVTTTPATSTPTVTGTPPTNTPTLTPIPNCPTMTPAPNSASPQGEEPTATASPTSTPFCVTVTATVTTTPPTSTPTVTGTPPTNTPTLTPIPNCPTMTPAPNSALSQGESPTPTASPTSTPFCVTITPTVTGTPPSHTPTPFDTPTPGVTGTATPTNTPTVTLTPTGGGVTFTPSPTVTPTATGGNMTSTPTPTEVTSTATATATLSTSTATATATFSTSTPTATATFSTSTPTATATFSTSTPTATGTLTTTMTASPTATTTATATATATAAVPPVELACNGATVDFEAGIPSNWMTDDNQGPVYWSTTEDMAACDNGINNTLGSGFAACADADQTNQLSSTDYDAELWTPAFDLSEVPTATLHFAAAYRDINPNGGDSFNVEVWDGSSWNNALSWNDDHRNPGEEVALDLSAYAGQNDIQVRFRYAGLGWDWWVQVDDIHLTCGEFTEEPSIVLEKTVGTEAGVCATTDTITLPTGGAEVTYCYKVINTSNVTLTEHSLVDDQLGQLLSNQSQTLAPATSFTHLETATVTTDILNTATWTASDGSNNASASASASVRIEPLCGATIQSVGSGAWNDAATWDLDRVPNADDIVLIQGDHIIDGQTSANVAGFCNYGTLRSPQNQSLALHASTFFKNFGDILGLDGEASSGTSCGTIGSSLKLRGKPFENEGTIQAGNGGDGERCGGQGGTTTIQGRNTSNSNVGIIAAGNGGDVSSTGSQAGAYVGGRGGDTSVRGNFEGSGFVDNDGTLQAGDGGNGHPNAALPQDGGNGGCLYINASALYLNGNQWGGLGGMGTGGGQNGFDGCVSIDPSVIDLSGADTSVRGGDIMIFGGDDWQLDLSGMSAGAISASNDLTLAVGENSTIDLTDNNAQIMDVAGNVTIASDNVQLDQGSNLSDVIDATAIKQEESQILYGVELNGPGQVIADAKSKQVINLTVLNSGPMTDTYSLEWSNSAGWQLGDLPDSITIGGLESQDIMLMLTPPAKATNGDSTTITLSATSEGDESQTTELTTLIVVEGGSFTLHLPIITRD